MSLDGGKIFHSEKLDFLGMVCPKTDVKNQKKHYNFWGGTLVFIK